MTLPIDWVVCVFICEYICWMIADSFSFGLNFSHVGSLKDSAWPDSTCSYFPIFINLFLLNIYSHMIARFMFCLFVILVMAFVYLIFE